MTTRKLDDFFRSFLEIESFSTVDVSLNGLQVDNDGSDVGKVAFAVDGSMETFKRAAAAGAGLVFVHHGLFWGVPLRVTGGHRERLRFLLEHNLALYAVHLPLDQHPQWGNNALLADLLGIVEKEPFGLYHGRKVGYKGKLGVPLTVEDAVKRISFMARPPVAVYPFGKRENQSCAVISGGAPAQVQDAIDEGIDLYVTGESSHQVYHSVLEAGINMVCGGHYLTEVWGVRKIMEQCGLQLNLDVEFIDVPTGL
jgi:dinuclear metal center YbgI/SA1388 family protein